MTAWRYVNSILVIYITCQGLGDGGASKTCRTCPEVSQSETRKRLLHRHEALTSVRERSKHRFALLIAAESEG